MILGNPGIWERVAGQLMRLLFSSDLHGDDALYARLVGVVKEVRPELIVLGGDMYPDDTALEPKKMGRGQPDYVRQTFRKYIEEMRAASQCRQILVIFGNHDWGSSVSATLELEKDGLLRVLDLERPFEIDGLNFLGYSCTPPTPWFVKDFERLDRAGDTPPLLGGARWDARFSRPSSRSATQIYTTGPTIAEELSHLRPPPAPWVFVAHAPPAASKLDRYYGNLAWGSKSVREALEKHKPMLSLHGHIHESPEVTGAFFDQIGPTIAVNPGQGRAKLHYATMQVDVKARKVLDLQHGRAT